MIDHELLLDLTESYLRSVIAGVSNSLDTDLDVRIPFGELGLDSFHVLKIIRRLEADFGTLSKSLLFENFNINDLANYFVAKHEQTLAARFADKLQGADVFTHAGDQQPKPADVPAPVQSPAGRAHAVAREAEPIRILE